MAKETILIVDDEQDIVDAVAFPLQRDGYRVLTANDGARAISLAQEQQPDAIVLDLMLPEVGGLDVCRTLRAQTETRHTPILMVTAKTEEADRVLGLELGADDYLTKPFSVRELIARIKAVLRRVHGC
jgi:two-component system, OmpR family, alkaline phosphatase synthesis response regulator PhoP